MMNNATHRTKLAGILLVIFSSLALTLAAHADTAVKKTFDLPAGDAASLLKTFADQSGEQIVYPTEQVRGVQTKAVHGEYTAREALDVMLAQTGLEIVQDPSTGAIVVRKPSPSDKRIPVEPAPGKSSMKSDSDETVVLSPFEVQGHNKGYYASNSLSGTRLNTKLEDVAASISVVTKQQLSDTAALDVNDIFMYEINTEGTSQWTSFTVDRGNVSDDIQSNPNGATRMRGLSSANIAIDGFTTTLPLDTYNIDSIEISRGPNSSIFGLGNTGGGININIARANTAKDITSFTTRGDSYDGWRANFDVNRPLIKDKLAIRTLGLYEDKGFVRKPASDTTRRFETAITASPFKKTTVRALFESYRNFNSRPNSTTPRDMISDWISSGKPTYDPITQMVHLANGTSVTETVASSTTGASQYYGLGVTDNAFIQYPSWYIENGQVKLYTISVMPSATGTGPNNVSGTLHLLQNGTYYGRTANANAYPLYMTKGVTDKSLYDWTSVNLAAPNYSKVKGETSMIELEQIFLDTERQKLALQAGWLYERVGTNSRSFLGNSDGGKMQVYLDINEKLLDGSVNPFFLQPYVGGSQPAFKKSRNNTDNYRATMAYSLDLTHETGWLRWLGRNTFSAYTEYKSYYAGSLGYKDTMSSTEAWMSPNTASFSRNSASFRSYPRYYIGDNQGYNVDYAPTGISAPPNTYTLRYYNGVTGTWINEPVDFSEYYYANRLTRRLLSTYGGTWQGSFLKDRIIPIIGARQDLNRSRDGNSAINPTSATNGFYDTSRMNSFGDYDWYKQKGNTTQAGVVLKVLSWLNLTYNQSNSFMPGSLAYNVYGQPLPDPKGKTRDYGFVLKFFNDRLIVSAKQYETYDYGRGTSDINTIVQRAVRLDSDGNADTTKGDPDLESFLIADITKTYPSWTPDQISAEVLKRMQVDPDFIDGHRNKTHNDDSDAVSTGKEIEAVYNATDNWTMKLGVTQARPLNGTMSPALQEYVASRYPIWTTVTGPSGARFWTSTDTGSTTPQAWYLTNLEAPMKLAIATQGKLRTQAREWRVNYVTDYKLAGLTDISWLKPLDVGGAVRWEDKACIGYYGAAPDADGVVRSLDANRPVYDKARTYYDLMAGYNLRFMHDKVRARVQLNVRNVFESGRLQPVAVNPDGSPWAFRIVDPRQFILTVTFDL